MGNDTYEGCYECHSIYTEEHHVVFRSQFKGLEANWNKRRLCPDHHRGNKSPHRDKSIDNRYKREVQQYLTQALHKDYYTIEELLEVLELRHNVVYKIVKPLKLHKEGYEKMEIIRRILGGRLYDE